MIRRRHTSGATVSTALYSPCGAYRYTLVRTWDRAAPPLAFIMLNPSTATERANDPTIARCEKRAREGGFGGVAIANLFALRATHPAELKRHPGPVGPDNDAALGRICRLAGLVVAGWGVHGAHLGRAERVTADLLRRGVILHALGRTKDGHPRHPLYMPSAAMPEPWSPAPWSPAPEPGADAFRG